MEFFNQTITRMVATSMMDFFSRISIEKFKTISVSGDEIFAQRNIIPVPIQWATREKWVEIVRSSASRKAMNPSVRDLNPVEMQWVLPRISCNLTSLSYDESRRLTKTQQVPDYTHSVNNKTGKVYTPAPYNLTFEVSTISRHLDDNLQIMEQILPYFAPTMSLSLNLYDNRETESVPITLNSISMDNPTDLPEFEERIFTNIYTFTVKINYYMMKKLQSFITSITTNFQSGSQIVQISKDWIESQQKFSIKFNEYLANANRVNPFISINGEAPNYIDTTRLSDFATMQRLGYQSSAISGNDAPFIAAFIDTGVEPNLIYLMTTSASAYDNNFNIYYRINNELTIYKYEEAIEKVEGMNELRVWVDFTDKTDVSQFSTELVPLELIIL